MRRTSAWASGSSRRRSTPGPSADAVDALLQRARASGGGPATLATEITRHAGAGRRRGRPSRRSARDGRVRSPMATRPDQAGAARHRRRPAALAGAVGDLLGRGRRRPHLRRRLRRQRDPPAAPGPAPGRPPPGAAHPPPLRPHLRLLQPVPPGLADHPVEPAGPRLRARARPVASRPCPPDDAGRPVALHHPAEPDPGPRRPHRRPVPRPRLRHQHPHARGRSPRPARPGRAPRARRPRRARRRPARTGVAPADGPVPGRGGRRRAHHGHPGQPRSGVPGLRLPVRHRRRFGGVLGRHRALRQPDPPGRRGRHPGARGVRRHARRATTAASH